MTGISTGQQCIPPDPMGPSPSSTSITDSAAGSQGLGVANKPDDGDGGGRLGGIEQGGAGKRSNGGDGGVRTAVCR